MSDQKDQLLKEDEVMYYLQKIHQSKKKYSVIPVEVRERFIKRVISHEVTIKEAAKEFGIKFSTSKAILQVFKREGRIGKKKSRQRKPGMCKKNKMNATANSLFNKICPVTTYKTENLNQSNKQQNQNLQNSMQKIPSQQTVQEPSVYSMENIQAINGMQIFPNQVPVQFQYQMQPQSIYNNPGQYQQMGYIPQMPFQQFLGNSMYCNPHIQQQQGQYPIFQYYQRPDSGFPYPNPFQALQMQEKQVKEEQNNDQKEEKQVQQDENYEIQKIKIESDQQYQNMVDEYNKPQEYNYNYYFE